MHILLTGGTGYLGSHLARRFIGAGHTVTLLRRATSRMDRLRDIEGQLRLQHIDALAQFDWHDVDAIVHAATCYGRLGESELDIFEANLAQPLRWVAQARGKVPLFINIDTSLPPAINTYALSKNQFLQWLRLALQGSARILNIRFESVYGPADDPTKFVTHLLGTLMRAQARLALTAGQQQRDFIHVDDAVDAFMLLLKNFATTTDDYSQADIGSGQAVSIKSLVQTAQRLCGSTTQLDFGALPYRANELMHAKADVSVLENLGWQGARDIETGLAQTIAAERIRFQ